MRLGDVECDARHGSLPRYEERLERSEKTTSHSPGTTRMATAAHRARDRGGRETAGAYLKAAGIGVRPPRTWAWRPPAKPANENEVTTGFGVELSDSRPKDG